MSKELKEKLEFFRKALFADKLKKGKVWNGYQVYIPFYKKGFTGGFPKMILVKGSDARISTSEECFSYIAFTQNKDAK